MEFVQPPATNSLVDYAIQLVLNELIATAAILGHLPAINKQHQPLIRYTWQNQPAEPLVDAILVWQPAHSIQ